MAFSFSPKIVTDGLVLALDAANPKSYVSGSTVWRDLTANNNNGALTNGPTFSAANGGSVVFDGVDDYTDFGIPTILDFTTNMTLSVWINRSSSQPSVDGGVVGKLSSQAEGYRGYMLWYNNNAISLYMNGGSYVNTPTLTANIWYNIVGTYNGQNAIIYLNGVQQSTFNAVVSINSVGNSLLLGRYPFGGGARNFAGKIADTKIYNRALSATEVLQNYNATKGRFGLT